LESKNIAVWRVKASPLKRLLPSGQRFAWQEPIHRRWVLATISPILGKRPGEAAPYKEAFVIVSDLFTLPAFVAYLAAPTPANCIVI
jgi:hypothetical protein